MHPEVIQAFGSVAEFGPKVAQTVAQRKLSPAAPAYWRQKIVRRENVYRGTRQQAAHWSIRLQRDGMRRWINLGTADAREAADKARDVSAYLEVNGWEATLAHFRVREAGQLAGGTVGAYLADLEGKTHLRPAMMAVYTRALRQIVAWAAGIQCTRARFSPAGAKAWQERIGRVHLRVLSPDVVRRWYTAYINASGYDAVRRRSAERSAASIIRNARALFRDCPSDPFRGVKIHDPHPKRYRSAVDPGALILEAQRDLPAQLFLALGLCLWAGLRKREADLLEWQHVDLAAGVIRITRTVHFAPKTDEGEREIDIPAAFVEILRAIARPRGFVMDGLPPRDCLYNRYRCGRTWKALAAWLRLKGIRDQKPVHSLRKESGSLIAQQYGIEAARAHLGHRDIQTTSAHYVAKKARREVTFPAQLEAP